MTKTLDVRGESRKSATDRRGRTIRTPIEKISTSVYRIPTDAPESDGTYSWDSTTLVVVEAVSGDKCGLGYTYANTATAQLISETLSEVVRGRDAMDVPANWAAMVHAIRNLGRPGISSMAIAAVDAVFGI